MGVHVSPVLKPPPTSLPIHPSGSSQCTGPERPVPCIEPGLAVCFTYDNTHTPFFIFRHIPFREMTLLLRPLFSLVLERYNTTVLFYTAERTLHCHYRSLVKRSARITVASHTGRYFLLVPGPVSAPVRATLQMVARDLGCFDRGSVHHPEHGTSKPSCGEKRGWRSPGGF